jgi:hypothetical protein
MKIGIKKSTELLAQKEYDELAEVRSCFGCMSIPLKESRRPEFPMLAKKQE